MTSTPWPAPVPAWDGDAVVVTGVGRAGQAGAVVARCLAEHGATVHCVDRDAAVQDRVAELSADGLRAVAHQVDLSAADAVQALAARIGAAHGGRVAAVAAIAGGFAWSGPIAEADASALARQLTINATSAFTTARAFAPLVRAAQGAFVFVASPAALPGGARAGLSAYAMAKGAIAPLVATLAAEEGPHGVRVNALAPTALRTAQNLADMGDGVAYVEREEFAAAVLALCAPAWRRLTGQVLTLA
jgi:NAD(P)-dependent dehydrogenase (short-subunit alcohol dehydrogenase family)